MKARHHFFRQLAATNGQLSQGFNLFGFWNSSVYQSILAFQSYDKSFEAARKHSAKIADRTQVPWTDVYPPGYLVQRHLCFIDGVSLPLDTRKEFLA